MGKRADRTAPSTAWHVWAMGMQGKGQTEVQERWAVSVVERTHGGMEEKGGSTRTAFMDRQ